MVSSLNIAYRTFYSQMSCASRRLLTTRSLTQPMTGAYEANHAQPGEDIALSLVNDLEQLVVLGAEQQVSLVEFCLSCPKVVNLTV